MKNSREWDNCLPAEYICKKGDCNLEHHPKRGDVVTWETLEIFLLSIFYESEAEAKDMCVCVKYQGFIDIKKKPETKQMSN